MKDYSEMSDIHINAAVSRTLYGNLSRGHELQLASGDVDYCNNATDAWPIIVENKISISHEIARYCASLLSYDKRHFENETDGFKIFRFTGEMGDISSRAALRAAMIVFLMMKDRGNSHA
ncbi:TPA: DUF2591 family protein [Yersinia enterocolitica]|nr:DUF2591 family protein [Yersinia enterocolitica]